MRVLQLAKFYPPERGGIESIVHELTEGLNAAGCPTDVLCAHRQRCSVDGRAPAGYRVVRAGSLGSLLSTSLSPTLPSWLARLAGDYDVIHAHMPNPMAAWALWRVRPRARLVLHWHSDVIRQQRALRLYEPLQRWLLARADTVVATSSAYAEASAALAPWADKLAVVHLGIGDNHARSDPARVAALRAAYPGRKIVFALGRMAPYKGFDVLIEAASLLPDDTIVLVGGGGALLEPHRAQVAARGLGDKLRFLGPIAEDDLTTYHQAADVFCMPSLNRAEAFGVAMLEAMAAARPVVCSDVAGSGLGFVNVDGLTGLTVPPGSAPALADALARVLAEPALAARLGAAARERYLSRFTATAMVEETTALYSRLVATHAPSSE